MSIPYETAKATLEAAFAPYRCHCRLEDGGIGLSLYPHDDEELSLYVTAIPLEQISTARALSHLVLEIRQELASVSPSCTEHALSKRRG